MATSTSATATDAATAGFAIYRVARFGGEPTLDDPDGAWSRFLAAAPLDDVLVADDDIEAVATEPLTLVLTGAGGQALRARGRGATDDRFVVTLAGARLYAGRIMVPYTARALRHPLVHVDDRGPVVLVTIVPQIAARRDTAVTAPPALLAHFAAAGKLLPAGAAPTARYQRRSWVAEATSTKPGDPTSQVAATCDASACTLTLAFRRPGAPSDAWDQQETMALDRADFDAVWAIVLRARLTTLRPAPRPGADRLIHPPRYRVAITSDRGDGAPIATDQRWTAPSTADAHAREFLTAAGALGRRRAVAVPVRYFPE